MLRLDQISKAFRVPRVRPAAGVLPDPRREALPGGLGRGRHERFWALRDVSFSVARGETLGLIGSNGSGKSTLLKILAGVMTADSGTFTADGQLGALLELGAGFHPDLSGIENAYLNGALLGLSPRRVGELLPAIIEFAELETFMDMPVRHFSSGMQARLGFAIATSLAPEILLLDETFAAGDVRFQGKALAHLAGLRARGHTLVLVSHSLQLLLDMADRVVWLDRGRLRMQGAPREVLAAYQHEMRVLARAGDARAAELDMGLHGFDLLYEPLAAAPRLRIAGVQVAPASIARGEALRVTLQFGGEAGPAPASSSAAADPGWLLHASWARVGEPRVLAESRLPLALHGTDPCVTLEFPAWPLAAGAWRLGLGLRRLDAPADAPWESRWLHPRPIEATTPSGFTVPAFAHVPARWTFDAR